MLSFIDASVRPARTLNHMELLRLCQEEQLIDSFEARGGLIRVRNAGLSYDLTAEQAGRYARAILRHAPTFARLRTHASRTSDGDPEAGSGE